MVVVELYSALELIKKLYKHLCSWLLKSSLMASVMSTLVLNSFSTVKGMLRRLKLSDNIDDTIASSEFTCR